MILHGFELFDTALPPPHSNLFLRLVGGGSKCGIRSSMSPEQPLASTGSSSAPQTLPPPKAPAEVMVPPPEAVPTQAIPVPKARAPAEVMVPPPAVVPSPAIPVPKARAPAEVMAPPPAVVPSPAIPVPKARAPEEVMAPAPDATPETKLGRRPATAAKSAPATDPRMVEAMCKNTLEARGRGRKLAESHRMY